LTVQRAYQIRQPCQSGQDGVAGSSCQPHATACPTRAPPRCDSILPVCCCDPAAAPELSAKTCPSAARDLCCHCPSLPPYAAGKRARTSLPEMMQVSSELSAFILGFCCGVQSHLAMLRFPI